MKQNIVLLTLVAIIAAQCASLAWAASPSVVKSDGYFYLNGSATKTIMKGVEEERSTLTNAQCDSLAHRLQSSGVNLIVVYYDPSRNYRQNDYFYQCMQDHGIWIAQHFGTLKKETTGSFDNVGGVLGVTPDEAWLQARMVDLQSVITQCAHHSNILFWWLGGEFVHPNPLVTYDQTIIKSHIQRYRDRLTALDINFTTRRPFTVSHHFMEFGTLPVYRFFNYGNDANGVPLTDFTWITAASHFHNGDVGLPGPTWGAIIPEVTEDLLLNQYLNAAVSANGNKPIFMGGWYGDAHTLKICEASNQYDRMFEKWKHLYNVNYNGYSVYHVDEWAGNAMPHALYKWNGAKCELTEAGKALNVINTNNIIFTSPAPYAELIPGAKYVAKVVDNFWQTATATISKVEFSLGGAPIGTVTSAPWTLTFTAPSSKSVATTLSAKAYYSNGTNYTTTLPVNKLAQSYYNKLNVGSTTPVNVVDPINNHGLSFKLEQIAVSNNIRYATILVKDVNTNGTWYETVNNGQMKQVSNGTGSKLFIYAATIFDGSERFAELMIAPYQYPSLDIIAPMPGVSTNSCEVHVATNYAGKNVPWNGTGNPPINADQLKSLTFNGSAAQSSEYYTWLMSGTAGSRTMTVNMTDKMGNTVSQSVTVNYDPTKPFYVYKGPYGDDVKTFSKTYYWDGTKTATRGEFWQNNGANTYWFYNAAWVGSKQEEINKDAGNFASVVNTWGPTPSGSTPVYVIDKTLYNTGSWASGFGFGTITHKEYYQAIARTLGKDSQGRYRVWASTDVASRSPADAIDPVVPAVSITAPANGATVSGTVTITATATDESGVIKVDFYVEGMLVGTDNTSPYSVSWNTSSCPNSVHSLKAKAYDPSGNEGISAAVNVTVSGGSGAPPPVIVGENGGNYGIYDYSHTYSPITISGQTGSMVRSVSVQTSIVHAYYPDLKTVAVIHPDGTEIGVGINTTTALPDALDAKPVNGTWQLHVYDGGGRDTGYIDYWKLTIEMITPPAVTVVSDNFGDNNYTGNPAWTVTEGSWTAASGYLQGTNGYSGTGIRTACSINSSVVSFEFRARMPNLDCQGLAMSLLDASGNTVLGFGPDYCVPWGGGSNINVSVCGTSRSVSWTANTEWHKYKLVISGGKYSLYYDGNAVIADIAYGSGQAIVGATLHLGGWAHTSGRGYDDIIVTSGGKSDIANDFAAGMNFAKTVPVINKLNNCAPNPFAGQTIINFQLAKPAQTTIMVYNVMGQPVKTLVNECLRPGYHLVKWDGRDASGSKVAAGVYLYRMEAGDYSKTNKMTVLR